MEGMIRWQQDLLDRFHHRVVILINAGTFKDRASGKLFDVYLHYSKLLDDSLNITYIQAMPMKNLSDSYEYGYPIMKEYSELANPDDSGCALIEDANDKFWVALQKEYRAYQNPNTPNIIAPLLGLRETLDLMEEGEHIYYSMGKGEPHFIDTGKAFKEYRDRKLQSRLVEDYSQSYDWRGHYPLISYSHDDCTQNPSLSNLTRFQVVVESKRLSGHNLAEQPIVIRNQGRYRLSIVHVINQTSILDRKLQSIFGQSR